MNFEDEITKIKDLNRYHTLKYVKDLKIDPVVKYPCDKCVTNISCNSVSKILNDIYSNFNYQICEFYASTSIIIELREKSCPYLEYWQAYNNMLIIKNNWGKDLRYSHNRVKYHLRYYLYGKLNNYVYDLKEIIIQRLLKKEFENGNEALFSTLIPASRC